MLQFIAKDKDMADDDAQTISWSFPLLAPALTKHVNDATKKAVIAWNQKRFEMSRTGETMWQSRRTTFAKFAKELAQQT